MDLKQAKEYIDFLLDDIEDYKKDWLIEEHEIQKFIIEYKRFKSLIEHSIDVPYEIRDKILETTFSYSRWQLKLKFLLRNLLHSHRYQFDGDPDRELQIDGKHIVEGFENQLLTLRREIERFEFRHKLNP